jgi:3-phenylpropionate/trans-cinnamate dioxygenase ferredoxin reductase component
MKRDDVVIVGGGLAAQRFSETLRARDWSGPIRMVCAEPLRPYDRPPLSKELLAGEVEHHEVHLRPESWYADKEVDLLLGRSAERLDPERRVVVLDDGEELRFAHLLVATGSEPRTLPGLDGYENVHTLRTVADALRLRQALDHGARLAVVGAGFIGLEVAATARRLGAEVTLIEAAETPLVAVLGRELGDWFARLHREEGVQVLLSAPVSCFHGNGHVEEIELQDGRRVRCDAVVVGIGVAPATGWLAGSGLEAGRGVPMDPGGRTALPGVLAAGDAALPYDPVAGRNVRSEHWESAAIQGATAARTVLGLEPGPWRPSSFWSDQYGVRIHFLGHRDGSDAVELDGDPASRDFTALFRRERRTVAGLLVGRPHALPELRKHIHEQRSKP